MPNDDQETKPELSPRASSAHAFVGETVLYVVPETLKCRPAIVIEVSNDGSEPVATLFVFRLPEDTAFVHANTVEKVPMDDGDEGPRGGTWHER